MSATEVLWLASRSAAITAYVALTLDVAFGLFLSTAVADRWISRARSVEVHRWLSSVTLALTAVHAVALLGDRLAHLAPVDLVVPFHARRHAVAVGLGVLAVETAAVLHGSFLIRARLGARVWRALHYLSFAVYVLATAHGIFAGSDVQLGGMRVLFAGSAGVIVALTGYRVLAARVLGRSAAPA